MADGTRFRLDTADLADGSGWSVESNDRSDKFVKHQVTIEVQHSSHDDIETMVKSGPAREFESVGPETPGKVDLLRFWLTGRSKVPVEQAQRPARSQGDFAQKPGDWSREEFMEAVQDSNDREFLLRILELVDANSRLPSEGLHSRVYFGKRPTGGMFVYPFGRRHPPYKFFISNGELVIAGCWTGFPQVTGHPGFAELASLLDLDESGPAKRVPVAGLDPDEVWKVGDKVSQAING